MTAWVWHLISGIACIAMSLSTWLSWRAMRYWRRRAIIAARLLQRASNGVTEPARPVPSWPCSVCGARHTAAQMKDHEHRDDPRSAYYEGPNTEAT